jgi:hypothetical protein
MSMQAVAGIDQLLENTNPEGQNALLKSKTKTEAANCYGQFLKFKKQELKDRDSNAKFNQKEALQEWRGLDQERRNVFVKLYREEKEKMQNNNQYRNRKLKLVKKSANEKKRKQKEMKALEDEGSPTIKYLEELESIDIRSKKLSEDKEVLRESIYNLRMDNAVLKYKVKSKCDELESIKDKYEQLVLQHNMCKP